MTRMIVLADTDGARVLPSTLPAITFAQAFVRETGGDFDILLAGGPEIAGAAEAWRGGGAARVLVAAAAELAHPTADRVAAICAQAMRRTGAAFLAGASSAFGRDVLPRVAGLLDLPMVSDVLRLDKRAGRLIFRRPVLAGTVIAAVQIEGDSGVFSVRGAAFGAPERSERVSPVEPLEIDTSSLPQATTWIGLEAGAPTRPALTRARVVVAGGRPLQDESTFERLLGGLADKLGGAVGASGGAVSGGLAPPALLIGQTGQSVAPDLYIAAGISGSDQHVAGMIDSRVIVAVNIDPDAPIFQVADYGLVADLHAALPELTEKL